MLSFGIVIVCYNSVKTIRRTLQSIESQSVLPDEIIIVDGGSTDGTLGIIEEFDHLPIELSSEKDNGIYDAMNKGLNFANTDVIGYLNSDDAYSNDDCFSRIRDVFNLGYIKVFASGVRYVHSNGKILRDWKVSLNDLDFQKGGHFPHPGFYCYRETLLDVGGFNDKYKIAADYDLMLRACLSVSKSEIHVETSDILVNMFIGGASNSNFSNIWRGNKEIRQSLRENGLAVNLLYTLKRWKVKLIQRIT